MEQRDQIFSLLPRWLQDDVGRRFMFNVGLSSDATISKMNQAMLARMPGVGDPSALPYLGNDRVMQQGPGESSASFAARLTRAYDSWRLAGSARSVLAQVFPFIAALTGAAGAQPVCLTVGGYQARVWDVLLASSDPAEPPIHYQSPQNNWVWDGNEATEWWRTWLVLFAYPSAPVLNGAAATVASKSGNFVTLTGLAGLPSTLTSLALPAWITLSGAAQAGNNGTFQVTQWIDSTSAIIAGPPMLTVDANNGSIAWSIAYYPGLQPAPVWGFPGDTWGDDGGGWGVQLPPTLAATINVPALFAQLQALVRLWKGAHTWVPWIILSFAGDAQAPSGTTVNSELTPWIKLGSLHVSGENPDGTWGTWSKQVNGASVPARVTSAPGIPQFDCFIGGSGYYPPLTTIQVT